MCSNGDSKVVASKECSKCHEVKPLSDFNLNSKERQTYRTDCKVCQSATNAAYRESIKSNPNRVIRRYKTNNKSHKTCKDCNSELPIEEFAILSNRTGYRNSYCKACAYTRSLRRALKRDYGITLEEYDTMLVKQDHKCAVCGIHQDDIKQRLVVDHCHTTGAVRGLLCHSCNVALGHFKDDVKSLEAAINYLKNGGVSNVYYK